MIWHHQLNKDEDQKNQIQIHITMGTEVQDNVEGVSTCYTQEVEWLIKFVNEVGRHTVL